ncbi:MAG: hypothetical protein QOG95_3377, partial [Mycobacterium sp.]|nr:hypothetical protein [Mycobacterium sp.]
RISGFELITTVMHPVIEWDLSIAC